MLRSMSFIEKRWVIEMTEEYNFFKYKINNGKLGYYYEIYRPGFNIISIEEFITEQEARFAAIGHISTLQNEGLIKHD